MATDMFCPVATNILVHCLHWLKTKNRRWHILKMLYTTIQLIYIRLKIYTHQKDCLQVFFLYFASRKTWPHSLHCLQMKIEKAIFSKDLFTDYNLSSFCNRYLTISYKRSYPISQNILAQNLNRIQMNKKKGPFLKMIQPIYIHVQIGTHRGPVCS